MPKAYVMVMTGAGQSLDVVSDIRDIDGVVEAHVVAGDFDVVAELEADDTSAFLPLVTSQLQKLEGVGTTKTYIVLE